VTFALVATLAAVAGGWAVEANQYGGDIAALLRRFLARSCFRRTPIGSPRLLWFLGRVCPRRLRPARLPRARACCHRSCSRRDRLPVGAMRGAGAGPHPGPAPLLSRAFPPPEPGRQELPLTVRRGRCLLEPVNLRIIRIRVLTKHSGGNATTPCVGTPECNHGARQQFLVHRRRKPACVPNP
jgi:hypothetical protein